jgi:L-ascorbate metabolism protein UlaG (beta-lactamase superfamily)
MDISYLGKSNFKVKSRASAVVTATSDSLTIAHKSGGEDFVINRPGEYEVEGVSVFGYQASESNVYVIQFEDIRVLYLGDLAGPLSEKNIAELENIDVVIVSADTMQVKTLVEVVAKLEPYYVLPYGEGTAKFVTAYEHSSRTVKTLSISKLSLNDDLTEVIIFE